MNEHRKDKTMNNNNYCIILAGGKGRRLWPVSRSACPKQFLDFFGTGKTQLQETFSRFATMIPKENILICTTEEYAALLHEQIPDISEENAVIEPIARNTAPCVGAAATRIARRNMNARIVIAPSDQYISDEETFRKNIVHGLDIVNERDILLAMGVVPARPEPGYGYIQMGEPADSDGIYRVQSFTEKPDRNFARLFVNSGEFLWNTGLFLANIKALGRLLYSLFPDLISVQMEKAPDDRLAYSIDFIKNNYDTFPSVSLDYGIFEHGRDVHVMRCDFGWADLGTWHSVYEFMCKGSKDNVVIDTDVILEDCKDNIIKLSDGRLAVINGLEGYIVAEKDNVLFICKKSDSSALVRKYINETQIRFGDGYV